MTNSTSDDQPPAEVTDLDEHRLANDIARVRRKAANLATLAEALAAPADSDTAAALHDLARTVREGAEVLPGPEDSQDPRSPQ